MRYLIFLLLLTSCASTSSNSCNRYQAIDDCQAERNEFFNHDINDPEMDNHDYCEQIVPQCGQ